MIIIISLVVLALLSIIKTKKWINPVSVLLVLWSIIIGLSYMRLFGLYETKEKYYILIFTGLFFYFCGFMINFSKNNYSNEKKKKDNYQIISQGKDEKLNYGICYVALLICIGITLLKLADTGFDFSNISLFGSFDRSYGNKFVNMLYEFVAYPLYNTFICITIVDFFFGKRDKTLLTLTSLMVFVWLLISGGRIAIIRLMISIVICMSSSAPVKSSFKKILSNIKFIFVVILMICFFVYITEVKGFEPFFNIYSDFAIQPQMFQIWAEKISDQYAFGAASLFGFVYPFAYIVKNGLGLSQLPFGLNTIFNNINSTYTSWQTLGTYYICNAYTSPFWYMYYDGRIIGIILGMFVWGRFSRKKFNNVQKDFSIKNMAIYVLVMIGVIYSFTDMEFSKANYVLAYLFINKICCFKYKFKFRKGR